MTLIIQQTKADIVLVNAIKTYAKNNNEILQEVYAKAVKEFIDSYEREQPSFLASPLNGITINLKLPENLKKSATLLANKHNNSARRLYYTALRQFALKNKLINSREIK